MVRYELKNKELSYIMIEKAKPEKISALRLRPVHKGKQSVKRKNSEKEKQII